ncbi:MAG: DMT family transporter [Magnetospirillum sp. WYHS-4]
MVPTPGNDPLRGVFWMAFATLAGTGMLICIRFVGRDVHPLEIGFLRCLLALPLLLPWYLPQHGWRIPLGQWRLQVARGAMVLVTMLSYFSAALMLPLAALIAFTLTGPLFTTLGAALFLKERVDYRRWTAVAVGFGGALLVAAPDPLGPDVSMLGVLLALATALFGAVELVLLKSLSGRQSTWTNVVWVTLVMAAGSAAPAATVWTSPSPAGLAWLAGLAAFATLAQAAVSRAFYWSDVAPVMAAQFLQLVLAALAGWLLFGEAIGPTTLAGAALILAANASVLRGRPDAY